MRCCSRCRLKGASSSPGWAVAIAVIAGALAIGQQALRGHEAAVAAAEGLQEEVDRLNAKVAKLQREKAAEEKAKKDVESTLERAKNETKRWRAALLDGAAVLPLPALSAADSQGAEQKPLLAVVVPPLASAAEAAFSHADMLECSKNKKCSVKLLDVIVYGLRNALLAAHSSQPDEGLSGDARHAALWRGKQILRHIESFQSGPFSAQDEEAVKHFSDLLTDSILFGIEFIPRLLSAVPSPMRLPEPTQGLPLGVRGPSGIDISFDAQDGPAAGGTPRTAKLPTAGGPVMQLGLRIAVDDAGSDGVGAGWVANVTAAVRKALKRGWRQFEVPICQTKDAPAAAAALEGVAAALRAATSSGAVRRKSLLLQGIVEVVPGVSPQEAMETPLVAALKSMGVEHLDILVLRWKPGAPPSGAEWMRWWGVAENSVEQGHVRRLGLGNVGAGYLHDALRVTARSRPVILQNKLSIYFPGHYEDGAPGTRLCSLERAVAKGLVLQGYGVGSAAPGLLVPEDDAHARAVAKRHSTTPQQVLYAWALQLGAAVLVDAFDADGQAAAEAALSARVLTSGDMRLLSAVAGLRTGAVAAPAGDPSEASGSACVEDIYGLGAMMSDASTSMEMHAEL